MRMLGGDPAASPGAPGGAAASLFARAASSPLVQRVAGGALWSLAGSVVARALALLAAVLVARQLGAASFGAYSLALATAGMFQALSGFGLGETATRYLAGRYRDEREAAGRIVALSVLVAATVGGAAALALLACAPWFARAVLGAPALATPLRAGALLLVLGPVGGALAGVLGGLERFRLVASAASLAALASIPLLVVGARLAGATGAVIGTVVSTAIGTGLHAALALRAARGAGIVPRWASALREWRVLFSFSVPATLSNVTLAPVSWATSAMIAAQPGGMHELGLFSAANQWRNAILLLGTAAGAALLPLFSDLHESGRFPALRRAFWTSLAALGAAGAAAAAALALLAPLLMASYGDEFAGATRVLAVLVATGALSAPLAVAGHAIAGAGRMWLSLGLNLAWATILVSTAFALRARGALGLSTAHLAAYLVHLATSVTCAALLLRARSREGERHGSAR
jgi:O-antigen/teichoic acid export membrane protein